MEEDIWYIIGGLVIYLSAAALLVYTIYKVL